MTGLSDRAYLKNRGAKNFKKMFARLGPVPTPSIPGLLRQRRADLCFPDSQGHIVKQPKVPRIRHAELFTNVSFYCLSVGRTGYLDNVNLETAFM